MKSLLIIIWVVMSILVNDFTLAAEGTIEEAKRLKIAERAEKIIRTLSIAKDPVWGAKHGTYCGKHGLGISYGFWIEGKTIRIWFGAAEVFNAKAPWSKTEKDYGRIALPYQIEIYRPGEWLKLLDELEADLDNIRREIETQRETIK